MNERDGLALLISYLFCFVFCVVPFCMAFGVFCFGGEIRRRRDGEQGVCPSAESFSAMFVVVHAAR